MDGQTERHYWTAAQAATAIANGEVTSVELTTACLDRITALDGELNAICVRLDDRALAAATAADDAIAAGGPLGPLHGVPITVKEAYDIVDTPSTWGRTDRADHRPEANAPVIDRFEAAGAIIIGKTNVPENLSDWQSNNPVYGRVHNPWDTTRTPGGSSGGSAVALAAGYSYLDSGSDIGGSLRNPAHYCGIASHKPTFGIVPTTGHALDDNLRQTDISVTGPMARTMSDVRLCFDVIAGLDGPDAVGLTLTLPAPRRESLVGARIAVVAEEPVCRVSAETKAAIEAAADAAEAAGAIVTRNAELPVDSRHSHDVFIRTVRAVGAADLGPDEWAIQELEAAGDPTSWRTQVGKAVTQSHGEWLRTDYERSNLRRAWAGFFENYDLLLCPVAPTVAWEHDDRDRFDRTIDVDGDTIGYYEQLFWAGINNVAYLPASVIPGGLSEAGLPIGLQLIGPYMEDLTCMHLAQCLEAEIGGFVPPALLLP